jgi:hypothetical protein
MRNGSPCDLAIMFGPLLLISGLLRSWTEASGWISMLALRAPPSLLRQAWSQEVQLHEHIPRKIELAVRLPPDLDSVVAGKIYVVGSIVLPVASLDVNLGVLIA